MLICLIVSLSLAILCFVIHFIGLVGLSAVMRRLSSHPESLTTIVGQGAGILFIVMVLFAMHSLQIWLYALAFLGLGEFSSMEDAVYYSISTFTTVGFGDLNLSEDWRILGAAESMNGFLLIGWSTAFLVSVTARVRAFEASVDRLDE